MDRDAAGLVTGLHDTERSGDETFAWTRATATMTLPLLDRRVPWLKHVILLKSRVLDGHLDDFLIKTNRPGAGRSEWGKRKMRLVEKHLSDAPWLGAGYTDGWAMGTSRYMSLTFTSSKVVSRAVIASSFHVAVAVPTLGDASA